MDLSRNSHQLNFSINANVGFALCFQSPTKVHKDSTEWYLRQEMPQHLEIAGSTCPTCPPPTAHGLPTAQARLNKLHISLE